MTTSPVTSITDELIAELDAAAKAATCGPWRHATELGQIGSVDVGDYVLAQAQQLSYDGNSQRNKNAAYIALANPATILALLAERAAMQEQIRSYAITVENAEMWRRDAERWRAFINCARIKFFGWAGYEEKDPYGNSPGNYRHFGAEFWSIHSDPTANKEKAKAILSGFADASIAAIQEPKP